MATGAAVNHLNGIALGPDSVSVIAGWNSWATGYIDELRISDEALPPSGFLRAIPEPGSSALILSGVGALLVRATRKPAVK